MLDRAAVAMLMAAAAFAPACAQAPETAGRDAQIRLTVTSEGSRTVDVEGLPSEDRAFLARATRSPDEWAAILRVEVASDEPSLDEDERPPVLGVTAVSDGVLRFTPRFPFDPGQRYDVVFDPSSLPSAHSAAASSPLKLLHAVVEVPAPVRVASTHVVEVYPSGPEVPENHLRLYLVFSGPMSSSGGGAQVRLIDDQGHPVPDPFLPLELELWNEDRTRFTVLYDPGRVKRGIWPNEEMGRALVEGRTYTLVVGTDWRDAAGQPLVSEFRQEFRVGVTRRASHLPGGVDARASGPWYAAAPRGGLPEAARLRAVAPSTPRRGGRRPTGRWGDQSRAGGDALGFHSARVVAGGGSITWSRHRVLRTWPGTGSGDRSRSPRATDSPCTGQRARRWRFGCRARPVITPFPRSTIRKSDEVARHVVGFLRSPLRGDRRRGVRGCLPHLLGQV